MSIYLASKQDLLGYLSTAAGVTIADADVTFGVIRATTSAEQTTYNANSRITVTFNASSNVGSGKRAVFFNRLDLNEFSFVNRKGVKATVGINTAAMLPILKKLSGIPFSSDDLVDHTTYTDPDNSVFFQLEAQATSLGWFGGVTLDFSDTILINNAFVNNTLPGF